MDMRKIALIAGIVVVVAALVGLGIYFFGGKSGKGLSPEEVRRQNTLTLAKEYLEKGEYQRALDLLDGLLIENVNDEEAKALRDKTIDARRLAEETQKKQSEAKQDELVSSLSQLGDSIKDQARSQRAVSPEELRREELRREEEKKRLEEQRKLDEERRQEELKRLEEQKREAERRAEEEKARLEAMSKAEREKREKVVSLISEGVKSLSAQKYPEARDKFDEALSLDTNAAEAYAQKAEAFYQEDPENPENIQRAVDNANKAIEKDKNLWIPHNTLGKVYAQRRDYNNAVREYAEASRLNPTNDSILFELGKVQFRAGKFQDARMSFESSVHLNPKNEKAFFNLGAALRRLGDDELALKAYKNAIAVKPDYASAMFEAGEILRGKGDFSQAVDYYRKALTLEPNTERYTTALGVSYYRLERYAEAEKAFSSAIAIEPGKAESQYNMALVKLQVGKLTEAMQYAG